MVVPSGLSSSTMGEGQGGDVRLTARRLLLEDGGTSRRIARAPGRLGRSCSRWVRPSRVDMGW